MMFHKPLKAFALAAASISLLSACGNSNFQKLSYTADATAGNQVVVTKAKVDIVIFQDNSDSVMYSPDPTIATPISQMKPQMANFLANLDATVDYRVVVLPLLSYPGSLGSTVGSGQSPVAGKYILASDCSSVNVGSRCLGPADIDTFNNATGDQGFITTVNSAIGSQDYGFISMINNMNSTGMLSGSNRFLRSDASTAVILLTNGNDIDGVTYTNRGDGYMIPTYPNMNQSYVNYFAKLKGVGTNFYAVTANGGSCYGRSSLAGTQYQKMSSALNAINPKSSSVYDLCNGQMTSILTPLFQNVQALVQAVQFDYIVFDAQTTPTVSSLTVMKNGATVPQSATNGWQYVGQVSNQPTSYYPAAGNYRSGYAIRFFGSARYSGSDKIQIYYGGQ